MRCTEEFEITWGNVPKSPERGMGTSAGRGEEDVPMMGAGDSNGLAEAVPCE